MGTKLQARILHNLARQDSFDNIGRLFLAEAKQATQNPALYSDTIREVWREYYPEETAEQKQENLILIYFDGKEQTRNVRDAQKPIIPMRPPTVDNRENGTLYPASKPELFLVAGFTANKEKLLTPDVEDAEEADVEE